MDKQSAKEKAHNANVVRLATSARSGEENVYHAKLNEEWCKKQGISDDKFDLVVYAGTLTKADTLKIVDLFQWVRTKGRFCTVRVLHGKETNHWEEDVELATYAGQKLTLQICRALANHITGSEYRAIMTRVEANESNSAKPTVYSFPMHKSE